MAANKKLSGGLANLIGGADKNTAEALATDEATKVEEQLQTETEERATLAEEQDLINSIDDPELRQALEEKRNSKRGRPRKDAKARLKQEEEYTRFCTLVKREHIWKLKEICLRETLTLKEVLGEIFQNAIDVYEDRHGEITQKNHKGDVTKLFK